MTPLTHIRSTIAALSLAATMAAAAQSGRDIDTQGQQQVNLLRISQLMGKPVDSQDNLNAGRIENMALDLDNGRAFYIILNTSGAQDLPNKTLAIPFRALEFSDARTPSIKLNINRQRLQDAPPFDQSGWDKIGDKDWGRIVHEFYGLPPRPDSERDVNLVRASDAIKMAVNGKQRDDVGQVEDLLLDAKRGVIPVAIVSFTKGPAAGDKLISMPLKALDPVRGEKALVLNIDAQKLRDAPSFDKRNWPNTFDAGYIDRTYAQFDMQPNQAYGYAPPSGAPGGDNRDQDHSFKELQGGWVLNSEYGRLFNPSKIETITAKVVKVEKFTPMKDMSEGVLLRVRTDDNKNIDVHLGPTWYIDRQQHEFKEGNEVKLTGSRIELDGKPAIMAIDVRKGDHVLIVRNRNGVPRWDAWFTDSDAARERQ